MKKAKFFKFLNSFASLALLLNMSYLGVFFNTNEAEAVIARENLCTSNADIVLVMDRSYSMFFGGNPNKLTAAKTAANNFLGLLGTGDQSALVSFSDEVTLNKGLSNNHVGNISSTGNAVNALTAWGNTNIGDAIKLANEELVSVRADSSAAKVQILLTDGIANRPTSAPDPEAYAQAKAVEAANAGIKIFTIGLGDDVNQDALQGIADTTGGNYYFAPTQSDLQSIYDKISKALCEYGTISGCKYSDIDKDGDINDEEDKIAGWDIILSGDANNTVKTDENGCYTFSGLAPGNYVVNEGTKESVSLFEKTYGDYSSGITINWGSKINNIDFRNYMPICGNGILDEYETYTEECEINNRTECVVGDYNGIKSCSDVCAWGNCIPTESCGDNVINGIEECDGTDMGDYDPDHYICSECSAVYQPYCGDNIVNQESEKCDGSEPIGCETEAGYAGTKSCSECNWGTCQTSESCGDGTINGTEVCDDGSNNGIYGYCNSECTGDTPSECGNEIIEGEEQCDGGENCTNDCMIIKDEPVCGDKICNNNESCETCPTDCGECGNNDGLCEGYKTYTTNADFDEGVLINLSKNPADQLQLDDTVTPFGFIWVANSGKGTIMKINTETGDIIGEYRTSPDGTYGNPSRTTVDKDGSVWVGNRQPVAGSFAAITHVGLIENGQCEDRNGNGTIETSIGLGDVKAWTDDSGARGVATADDECIVHFTKISGSDARHISVDKNNNIWVSGISNRIFELVKGGKYNVPQSGGIIRTEGPVGYGGYGGLIDKDGVIWSASSLLRWDTANPLTGPNGDNWKGYGHSSYGLCIDSQGNVFNTEYGPMVRKFSPDGTLLWEKTHGTASAQGCVVDKNDDLWVAGSLSGSTVDHLKNDGTFVGSVAVGSGPTGVAVDNNNKVWVTNHYSKTVMRIDPNGGAIGADGVTNIGAVDFTSGDLGGYLYNYSDMTGSTLAGKADSGTWTLVRDSGVAGYNWQDITWNADVPEGAGLSVTIEYSNNNTTWSAPQTITNGQALTGVSGRYLKIKVSFVRSEAGAGPVLYDITIDKDCAETPDGDVRCGDNIKNQAGEECDGTDGLTTGYSCTNLCKLQKENDNEGPSNGGISYYPAPQYPAKIVNKANEVEEVKVLGETGAPELVITKTVNKEFANPGDEDIEYTIKVVNNGKLSAFNTTLKDVLPAGLVYQDDNKNEREWLIGDLAVGVVKEFKYKVQIAKTADAKKYMNTATVKADNNAEVSASASIEVRKIQVLAETGFAISEFIALIILFAIFSSLAVLFRMKEKVTV